MISGGEGEDLRGEWGDFRGGGKRFQEGRGKISGGEGEDFRGEGV